MPRQFPSYILIAWFVASTFLLFGQSDFDCDGKLLFSNPAGGFFSIDLKDDVPTPTPLFNASIALDATGYSVWDKKIYGIRQADKHLFRVSADGTLEDLGIPNNLNPEYKYYGGDVGPNGRILYVIGYDDDLGVAKEIFSIRIGNNNAPGEFTSGFVSLVSIEDLNITDLAFDPISGLAIGWDAKRKSLVSINIGGSAENFAFTPAAEIGALESLTFDREGRLYGIASVQGSPKSLIEFNKFNGQLINRRNIGTDAIDACSCPHTLAFEKEIRPAEILPCTDIKIVYRFTNKAAGAIGELIFSDVLPEEFVINSIDHDIPLISNVSGVGTNELFFGSFSYPLGLDSVVLEVSVGAIPAGRYGSQAIVELLPLGLNEYIVSDDPLTSLETDSTFLTVLENNEIFPLQELFICEGAEKIIEAPPADNYLWSDGSTANFVEVDAPGLYWVEMENSCGLYSDSILILEKENDLTIDLGADINIPIGTNITLAAISNSDDIESYSWSNIETEMSIMSCTNCNQLEVQPITNQEYEVSIMDKFGCVASDRILVEVEDLPAIYLSNVFSPNNDAINDFFGPQGNEAVEVQSMKIFNRWGSCLFEAGPAPLGDESLQWDGFINNKKASTGIYVYRLQLKFLNGAMTNQSGSVLLIR